MCDNLRSARIAANLNQKQVALTLGVAGPTVSEWETGKKKPTPANLVKLADLYNCSVDFLLGRNAKSPPAPAVAPAEMEMIKKYRALDEHGQKMVDIVMEEETARIQAASVGDAVPSVPKPAPRVIPLFGNSFAAGAPEPDFGNAWEDLEVPADSKADFAVRINGDSMEPYLPDGSIAYGRRGAPDDGEVGAFLLDGEFLVKQYCRDIRGSSYLFSLNRKRRDADVPVYADSGRRLECYGTIIMDKRLPLPNDPGF